MAIDRRTALKGLSFSAGSAVLTPLVSRLTAEAAGVSEVPKRFVFVVESNGVRPEQMAPVGTKRKPRRQRPLNGPPELLDVSLADKQLPFSLEPIQQFRERVTIVQGLSGRVCGGGHSTNFSALGCFPPNGRRSVTGHQR